MHMILVSRNLFGAALRSKILRRSTMGRLIIDGKRVYELDEACLQKKKKSVKQPSTEKEKNMQKRGK